MFKIWEETGDRAKAGEEARVSAGAFYYWRPRFEEGSYEAVAQFASRPQKAEANVGQGRRGGDSPPARKRQVGQATDSE